MTEADAKTKWCPFVRLTADGPGEWHLNRDRSLPSSPGDTQAYRCIASGCMAWRHDEPWTSRTEEGHSGDIVIRLKRKPGEPLLGYCGLAGAPQ